MTDLSDKGNEVIFFMDKSREVSLIPDEVHAQIEIHDDERTERIILSRTVIGRKEGVDIRIADKKISEEHAAIGYFDGIFFILDLKSKNGTYVNGKRIIERVLKDCDEIVVGHTKITFTVEGRLHDEATERWPMDRISVSRILEMISTDTKSTVFEDPTRILIDGGRRTTQKAPLVQVSVEVLGGIDKGKKFNFLQNEIIIGRGKGDVDLTDPDVSKVHAEITIYEKDQIFIRDLGSTNGTIVANKKVDRRRLRDGDLIEVGSTLLKIAFKKMFSPGYAGREGTSQEKTTRRNWGEFKLKLKFIKGKNRGKTLSIGVGEHVIGRDKCQIRLEDSKVSVNHATIVVSADGKSYIKDMSGKAGTFLNGKRVVEAELKKGDEIKVANTVIKIT